MAERRDEDGISSWGEYRRHVVSELERLNTIIERFDAKLDRVVNDSRRELDRRDELIWEAITRLKVEVAMLQVKSGAWGAGAGLMVVLTELALRKWGG